MSEDSINKQTGYNYLLGKLSQQQSEQFEAEYFAQPERSQEVWAIFDEMVERFVQRAMPADEAQAFAAQLQTKPFLRARAERLHTLYHFLAEPPVKKAAAMAPGPNSSTRNWFALPVWGWCALVTSVLVLGLLSLLPLRREGNRGTEIAQVQPTAAISVAPQPIATATPLAASPTPAKAKTETSPHPSSSSSLTPFYILLEETRTQGQPKKLAITTQTQAIALHFEVVPPFQSAYRGTVRTDTGKVVRSFSALKINRHKGTAFITLRLAIAELSSAGFSVQLQAMTTEKNAPPLLQQEFYLKKE